MQTGREWVIDAAGCDPRMLESVEALQALFDAAVRELGLTPVRPAEWVKFPPPGAGVTGFLLLRESHLACHSFPEHGVLAVNLYCCRPRERWNWEQRLAEHVGAKQVGVRTLERGIAALDGRR
ncbi:MAG: S-adenosylmethionine decarboxylase [Myxococcales bacterium]